MLIISTSLIIQSSALFCIGFLLAFTFYDVIWYSRVFIRTFSSDLAVGGRRLPCSSNSVAPAAVAQRLCCASSAFLAVVGLSVAAPSAFFRGENSSSLNTSNTTKLLPKAERKVHLLTCCRDTVVRLYMMPFYVE